MNESEIYQLMFSGLTVSGLFLIGFSFLTWFAGRCAVVTNESGNANIVSKILISAFALSSLWYVNLQFSYVALHINSASHSMAVLKDSGVDISARSSQLIDTFGGSSSEVPRLSLINEPIGIILVASIAIILLTAIWMGGSNND